MNFKRLVTGLDVAPILNTINTMPELWHEITLRQEYPGSSHQDTESIFLRGPKSLTREDYFFDLGSFDYPAMNKLGEIIYPVMEVVADILKIAELGRVIIVKLNHHGVIKPHIDEGLYADHFARFHICLQAEGSTLTAGDETQHFSPGEAWWFNHKVIHSGINNSDVPRIHLIFDAVTPLFPMKIFNPRFGEFNGRSRRTDS